MATLALFPLIDAVATVDPSVQLQLLQLLQTQLAGAGPASFFPEPPECLDGFHALLEPIVVGHSDNSERMAALGALLQLCIARGTLEVAQ